MWSLCCGSTTGPAIRSTWGLFSGATTSPTGRSTWGLFLKLPHESRNPSNMEPFFWSSIARPVSLSTSSLFFVAQLRVPHWVRAKSPLILSVKSDSCRSRRSPGETRDFRSIEPPRICWVKRRRVTGRESFGSPVEKNRGPYVGTFFCVRAKSPLILPVKSGSYRSLIFS